MDITITLLPEVESVFLLDGKFFEGEVFTTSDTVVYLTVMPLDACFVPYTVKLIGSRVETNRSLALSCKLSEHEYALRLGKRLSVFSHEHKNVPDDIGQLFFYYVKGRHFDLASDMLSKGLGAGLNEQELAVFLSDYTDIIKIKERYYAVDKAGVGHPCMFTIKAGKIDNIVID